MIEETLMRMAIEEARRGRSEGEPPFGAVIAGPAGEVFVKMHDTVNQNHDMTRHAEADAVREACRLRGPDLSGCVLVTTTEPCPMCFTTAWLARVSRIVIGCTMTEAIQASGGAQRELNIPVQWINDRSGAPIELSMGVLRAECLSLFEPIAQSK
jgi:tRNA(adenine34) deaminase